MEAPSAQPVASLHNVRSLQSASAQGGDPGQLELYIRLNALILFVAAAGLAAVRLWVVASNWLVVLIALLCALGLCLRQARAMLRRQRCVAAIATIAVSHWVLMIVATAIVPFALVFLLILVLLPALLGVQHLDSRRLSAVLGATILAAATMASLGHLQGGARLEALMPAWVPDVTAVLCLPFMAGFVSFLAWQNHAALVARAEALQESRARLVAVGNEERRRIERNLRDGAQQPLVAAAVQARTAKRLLTIRPERASVLLGNVVRDLQDTVAELRDLAHGIYPPRLTEHGLEVALRTAAVQCSLPATVDAAGIRRYDPEVEASVYFCCVEALDNAVKHAGERATVAIRLRDDDGLTFDVHDTGRGCDPAALWGHGLTNMSDRLGAVGGTLVVDATPGFGVHVRGRIPRTATGPVPSDSTHGSHRFAAGLEAFWDLSSRLWGQISADATERDLVATGLAATLRWMLVGLPFVLALHPLANSGWVLALAGVMAGASLLLMGALRGIGRGHIGRALLVAFVVQWGFALTLTALAPVALPHAAFIMIFPVLLAVPSVGRRHFRGVVGVTVAVAVVVVLAGRLLPGVGLQDQLPDWMIDVDVIWWVVVSTSLLAFLTWQNRTALVGRAEALQESRARLIAVSNQERRRIERDLHDGAQQRLVAAAVQSLVAQRLMTTQPERARALIDDLIEDLQEAVAELRDLARGVYPPQLTERGLAAALRTAVTRSPLPVTIDAGRVGRYDPEIETAVYFCCMEALQNAVKHAGDQATVTITLEEQDGLVFRVEDTGRGCDRAVLQGQGFVNMGDRLEAVGGTLDLDARPGAGVRIKGWIARPPDRRLVDSCT